MAVDMAVEETSDTSFYKNPPPRITGVNIAGNGTVRPKVKNEFGADVCSLNDLQFENLSDDAVNNYADPKEALTKPCCSKKV